jgi:hypothetical protein
MLGNGKIVLHDDQNNKNQSLPASLEDFYHQKGVSS